MNKIKLATQLLWEAAILPSIRFIIGYLPMLVSIYLVMKLTVNFWLSFIIEKNLLGWISWYIPAILIITFTFGVLSQNVKRIHPLGMVLMLITSLFIMQFGVSSMQFSLFYNKVPELSESVVAALFAVISIYTVALMAQRVWVGFLPKRKK